MLLEDPVAEGAGAPLVYRDDRPTWLLGAIASGAGNCKASAARVA